MNDQRVTGQYLPGERNDELVTAWYGERPMQATQAYGRPLSGESSSRLLSTDTIVAGRYRVEYYLAGGAFAAVYAVWDLRMRRRVAMKVYPESAGVIPLDEARLQGAVQHPNIMPLYDQCADPLVGVTCLVMPLYPGCDLHTLLETYGALPYRTTLACLDQICSAVNYLWMRRQVAHADIKPGNIWMTQSGAALLMDFNVPGQIVRQPLCRFGTPGYSAPEVWQGQGDARSDVFSLGCVAYACLTGVAPFASDADTSVGRYTPLPRIRQDIRPALAEVVVRALRVDPNGRFQSAREMRSALRSHRYQNGMTIWTIGGDVLGASWHLI